MVLSNAQVHVYGCAVVDLLACYFTQTSHSLTETYGPITRLYEHPEWTSLSAEEQSVLKARQGQSFFAADEALVVRPHEEGQDPHKLVEVNSDGKEVRRFILNW